MVSRSPETSGLRVALAGAGQAPDVAAAMRLFLRARSLVHAATRGERLGARRGAGVEFFEHAPYEPGADVRRVDALASARAGRLLVRTYREEARRTLHVLLDRSPSMARAARGPLREGEPSKWDAARVLALAAALAARRMGDRFRLHTFAGAGIERFGGCGMRTAQLALSLARLEPAPEGTRSALARSARELAAHARRGDALVVISDLFTPDTSPLAVFAAMHRRGQTVLVLHLLGAEDRVLPGGPLRLVPVEGEDPIELDGDRVHEDYTRALADFTRRKRAELTGVGARVALAYADEPLAPALAEVLLARPCG